MTREEAKELLPIMQAFAEGKTIQSKQINAPDTQWRDIEECNFLRECCDYLPLHIDNVRYDDYNKVANISV